MPEEKKQGDSPPEEEKVTDLNEEESKEPSLEDQIALLKEENAKLKNDYALAYADTENMRKRLMSEAESMRKYRIQNIASELLPVIDNLERALAQDVDEQNAAFHKGVEMIYEQLKAVLQNEGVTEIAAQDMDFDPNYHQAIMTEKVEDVPPGKVLQVLQKGYMLKDRILRASMVKVSE